MKSECKKILYIWDHAVSFGDSLTNFHAHLSVVKNKYPFSIIYVIVNPLTYTTGVTNLLIDKGLIDFVYPFFINKINNDDSGYYKELLLKINVDIVIHNNGTSEETVNLVKSIFNNQIHLQTSECDFKLQNLFNYFNISYGNEYLSILKESYHTNYVSLFVNSYLAKTNNKKTLALFSGSTRPLANIAKEGVDIITKLANELNIHVFLVGTSIHNLYDINGLNWEDIYSRDYQGSTNLIGNNWAKTVSILNKVDLIISGPTGASMMAPLINKHQIIITGGDSSIMEGCLDSYTFLKYTTKLKCSCENYPCDVNAKKTNIDLYKKCFDDKHPFCLNQNLNQESLRNLLMNI